VNLGFYLRQGIAYIPTSAKTEAGFYLQTAPVAVVKVSDNKEFEKTLKRFIAAGNPIIPTPKPDTFPKPDLHKYANVKSWSKFEKEASYWSLYSQDGIYEFGPYRRLENRGWEPDLRKIEKFPASSSIDDIVCRVVTTVQTSVAANDL